MLRFDDAERTLALSVRDIVEVGAPRGHLTLDVVRRNRARLAAGLWVHQQYQTARESEDTGFSREVQLEIQRVIDDWTVTLLGRVDGLVDAGGEWIVEEVKSTALDGSRLYPTLAEDWPDYVEQLEVYLWMLQRSKPASRVRGRLVFVSLADGARHTLDVAVDPEVIEDRIDARLAELIAERERRLAWMHERQQIAVHWPFPERRVGQDEVVDAVRDALKTGRPLLVQAPTGLGKTAAVLSAAVAVALESGRQVFWATSRTTQQPVVEGTLARLAEAGTPLRSVTLNARGKVCLNERDGELLVSCRPESCRFAEGYFDKVREHGLTATLCRGRSGRVELAEAGRTYGVCPYQLARDLTHAVDVVVGDINYVFDPGSRLRELFDGDPGRWIVVCDEAHQLVDRARAWRSPRIEARQAQRAAAFLAGLGSAFDPFAFLARQIEDAIIEAQHQVVGPARNGEGVVDLSAHTWEDLADRVEELGLDYALLKADLGEVPDDPWLDLARAVLRFHTVLAESDEETVALVDARPRREAVALCCLDPSPWLGPQIRRLGGFVGCSATLSPPSFYRDLLGLDPERLLTLDVPSPFPPERQLVVLAPRVSTAFKDRIAHAPATAELVADCIAQVPGNVAVYFPSFAMLGDIAARWSFEDREVLVQPRELAEADRAAWLGRLGSEGKPVVLAAVLGGIFAEGVDLPAGALSAVIVCGPAFPPVGLERDLLQGFYEARYDAGFLYASLVPGLTRVVQAAGRLIRRPEDRGAIVLVGRRFRWRELAGLLPETWEIEVPEVPAVRIATFFAETTPGAAG
ncbi:MAG: helicase C-terminal domain-containing protein [Myxococcota bacterium]